MIGLIILYQFKKKTPRTVINQFGKKFYGQNTSSHGGKYKYHRVGLLDTIPHCRIIRQVVIIKKEDEKQVIDFLKQYPLQVYVREVYLTEEDIKILISEPKYSLEKE